MDKMRNIHVSSFVIISIKASNLVSVCNKCLLITVYDSLLGPVVPISLTWVASHELSRLNNVNAITTGVILMD